MKLQLIVGLVTGFLFGLLQSESILGMILFAVVGLLAGYLAGGPKHGSERYYWLFLIVTIIMLTLAWFGVNIGEKFMVLPLVFILAYFIARIFWRYLSEGKIIRAK